jgi:DNA-binding transcriptional LysR family regulator
LSRRLHEIERQLDVVLFERTKGGTNLTTAGREFVASATRILDGVETELRRITGRPGSCLAGTM